ncbi:MAG: hypothetical protein GX803_09950 [Lentisphaerae bacterium]|jgi:hypothetical protein|nr:hypothetical protein [Lentisphaerota bacterium]
MAKERILITVKTYPELSKKYGETVCTAGLRPDGSWVRMYPVPFRRLEDKEQYSKFDWVECILHRNKKDPRPESFCPRDMSQILPVGRMDTSDNWRDRRHFLLKPDAVTTDMQQLIRDAKANRRSLATFKPTRLIGFEWEPTERDWDKGKMEAMRALVNQGDLFEDENWRKTFQVIPKLPYKFFYHFEDAEGKVRKLQIFDWEIGALFWNCHRRSNGDESEALEKVHQKYWEEFIKKDLHFFLGTTLQHHFRARNPWVIIGVLPIPHEKQMSLF